MTVVTRSETSPLASDHFMASTDCAELCGDGRAPRAVRISPLGGEDEIEIPYERDGYVQLSISMKWSVGILWRSRHKFPTEGVKCGSMPKKITTGRRKNERTRERPNERRVMRDEGCKRRRNQIWK